MEPPPPPPPTTTTSPGGRTILNKYKLTRLLGRGNFAKVYLAHHLTSPSSAPVAIKILPKPAETTTNYAAVSATILAEISSMRRLRRHPNILTLHEVLATSTHIYLVTQYAPNSNLFTHLKLHPKRRFSEPTALSLFQQLVSAVRFAHLNGVVHRDLKPQNLLMDADYNLKVSDFGLSALFEHGETDRLLHTACGTPAYTAPEVICRKGYDGEKADAWSCGVILYFFLVGCLPFEDGNLSNMYRAMRRRSVEFPNWVSRRAKQVIWTLLDPNPDTRMGLKELTEVPWFKKSYSEGDLQLLAKDDQFLDRKAGIFRRGVSAFDIIAMSSGLDLSGIFEGEVRQKEVRFTSRAGLSEIEARVEKVGAGMGFKVEPRNCGGGGGGGGGGVLGLVKGGVVLVLEAREIAATELVLVELRAVDGGADFGDAVKWDEIKSGLGDIAISWHNEEVC